MAVPTIGLIGLGTMGSNLALNIAEKGYPIVVFNRTQSRTDEFVERAGKLAEKITPTASLSQLVAAMKPPRAIILLVPAGSIVDDHIALLEPLLGEGDIIIDAGNAKFEDTNRRAGEAQKKPYHLLGIGVSGGAEGARHGPSIMGGGDRAAWNLVAPVMEAISAKYEDVPCAAYMGEAGAGHFVKMVHNGIEYADMQMIAEVYGIMRDGLGLAAPQIGDYFSDWNEGQLRSYLIEISAAVAKARDPSTGDAMLNVILDKAGQKGTGAWTSIEAQNLGTPITAIDAAVAARNMSARIDERKGGEAIFGAAPRRLPSDLISKDEMESALLAGKIACYAQGFAMLASASENYDWALPLAEIAKVWREGCIIRSDLLNDMASALNGSGAGNLMFAPFFAQLMKDNQGGLRYVVSNASAHGLPVPALSAALSYFDIMRTGRSTANMIQGQRDYFGAHTFERIDEDGAHNGPWHND